MPRRLTSSLWRIVRYTIPLSLLSSLFLLPLAHARLQGQTQLFMEQGQRWGSLLFKILQPSSLPRSPSTLILNGIEARFESLSVSSSREDVQRKLREFCQEKSPTLPLYLEVPLQKDSVSICFVPAEDLITPSFWPELMSDLLSLDLSRLGKFHAFLLRSPSPGTTSLLHVELDRLPVGQLFPALGDAPGTELPQVPRPHGRRVLSLSAQRPQSSPLALMNSYLLPGSSEAILTRYRGQLEEAGWHISSQHTTDAIVAQSSQNTLIVTATPAFDSNGGTPTSPTQIEKTLLFLSLLPP